MTRIDPLPFRLHIPGKAFDVRYSLLPLLPTRDDVADALDTFGQSVSYRAEGRLHLMDDALILEWRATETVEWVAPDGIHTDVDQSPIGTHEIPVNWLSEARVIGGWWWWWLRLRARRLDTFDGIPGARPGWIRLRVRRRDRDQAKAFAEAINAASVAKPLTEAPGRRRLE